MSEDRINKDPLLGGLDGMRAGQHWEGEPESLRHPENWTIQLLYGTQTTEVQCPGKKENCTNQEHLCRL